MPGIVPAFVKYYYSAPWGHTSWMTLFFDTRHIQEQSSVKYDFVGIVMVVFCMVVFCKAVFCKVVFCIVVFCTVVFCMVVFCIVVFCMVVFA